VAAKEGEPGAANAAAASSGVAVAALACASSETISSRAAAKLPMRRELAPHVG
jgi:hypothetical protein